MNKQKIANILKFKKVSSNRSDLDFRGFEISYFTETDKFLLLGKESVSHGKYTWNVKFEDCSKPVKKTWLLINALVQIEKEDWGIAGYSSRIQALLLKMFHAKTSNIPDDKVSSGNQYMVAEKYYKLIKKGEKWWKENE